nr:hypothetical protein [Tanacetum cinerariifolium]
MHKAFPLPVIKFPLAEEVPTASEESSHYQKKRDATAKRIALLFSTSEACPTDSGFEADQDRANIAKSSTLPHDSAPRVTSTAAVEGSMQQIINELTAFCTSLQRQHSELISKFEAQELEINRLKVRVKHLDDRKGVAAERSGDDVPIKGRNFDEGEAAAERISDDLDEMATVLTSMDAATIDAQVARELEEQLEREDQRISEQIARDAKVARIHVEEELHSIIDGLDKSNETVAKYLQEYQQFASKLPLERIIELISDLV